MANSPSVITRSTSLADILALAVSDGDYGDVIETAKTDPAGEEAAATEIPEHGGQLWANLIDDATKIVIANNYLGVKLWSVADAAERDALGSDDDLEVDDLAFKRDDTTIQVCTAVLGGSSSTWTTISATGSVAGPVGSTDHAVARWDGAGGATLQDSVVVISDAGAITGVASIAVSGNVDGRDVSADGATLDAHVASIANPHSTNLAQALTAANTTSGTNIEISNADQIVGEDGGSIEFDAGTGLVRTTDAIVDGDLEVTGKLTVAGLIDPTGLVLTSQAVAPHTPTATEGLLWYDNSSPPVLKSTTSAGTETVQVVSTTTDLAAVLGIGNESNGFDLKLTDGGSLFLYELGVAPTTAPGEGCLYVDNAEPNELHFVDDTGLDRNLSRPPVLCLSPATGITAAAIIIEATSLVPYVTLTAAGTTLISWTVALPWNAPALAAYTLRVRWAGSASSVGNVRFSASIRRWVDAESLGTLNTSATNTTVAANGTANVQQTSNFSTNFSLDSAAAGDTITITLRRLGDDGADTYAGDARVVACELLETIA